MQGTEQGLLATTVKQTEKTYKEYGMSLLQSASTGITT